MQLGRRSFLLTGVAAALSSYSGGGYPQDAPIKDAAHKRGLIERANAQWLDEHLGDASTVKAAEGVAEFASLVPPQQLKPFKDWDFYYTKGSFSVWRPNPGQSHAPVEVPEGFVTDLTSVPQWIWSSGIRPEGAYAYAALIHDYLYWVQDRPRKQADEIFLFAMEDSKVDEKLRKLVYKAVDRFGGIAWGKNAKLKKQGERRILREFPDDFTISWREWKQRPGVFRD